MVIGRKDRKQGRNVSIKKEEREREKDIKIKKEKRKKKNFENSYLKRFNRNGGIEERSSSKLESCWLPWQGQR